MTNIFLVVERLDEGGEIIYGAYSQSKLAQKQAKDLRKADKGAKILVIEMGVDEEWPNTNGNGSVTNTIIMM